jgi:hypothetical protein
MKLKLANTANEQDYKGDVYDYCEDNFLNQLIINGEKRKRF